MYAVKMLGLIGIFVDFEAWAVQMKWILLESAASTFGRAATRVAGKSQIST